MMNCPGLAGLEVGEQSVLFRGKVLSLSDRLEDVGVSSGDVLNVLKGRKTTTTTATAARSESEVGSLSDESDLLNEDYSEAMKNVVCCCCCCCS